jgi:ribose-phosphate pyrophosphokinase
MTNVAIQYLPDTRNEAMRLAKHLGIVAHEISLHRFPDDELRITAGPAAATTIIYGSLHRPNDKLVALLFAAEALRREGANRLVLAAPYLCYMRQDASFQKGQAVSQRAIGKFLAEIFDRVITVNAHLHRISNINAVFPGIEADDLSATPAIADTLRSAGYDRETIVVGPDEESRPWVSDLANRLCIDYAVARKARRGDQAVDIGFENDSMFAGRPVLIVDDIVSSGGTLTTCAKVLAAAGARRMDAIIIHALFKEQLVHTFTSSGIGSVRSTSSIPHPTNAIALDSVLIGALRRELQGAAP